MTKSNKRPVVKRADITADTVFGLLTDAAEETHTPDWEANVDSMMAFAEADFQRYAKDMGMPPELLEMLNIKSVLADFVKIGFYAGKGTLPSVED